MKEIPKIYKDKIDTYVLAIADATKELIPFIGELGSSIEFYVDEYKVSITFEEKENDS